MKSKFVAIIIGACAVAGVAFAITKDSERNKPAGAHKADEIYFACLDKTITDKETCDLARKAFVGD